MAPLNRETREYIENEILKQFSLQIKSKITVCTMCEREIFMIWILAIMMVVLIVFTIKEVFLMANFLAALLVFFCLYFL